MMFSTSTPFFYSDNSGDNPEPNSNPNGDNPMVIIPKMKRLEITKTLIVILMITRKIWKILVILRIILILKITKTLIVILTRDSAMDVNDP